MMTDHVHRSFDSHVIEFEDFDLPHVSLITGQRRMSTISFVAGDDATEDSVKEFITLEYGINTMPIFRLIWNFTKLMVISFGLGVSYSVRTVVNMLGFYILAHTATSEDVGSFGLGIFFETFSLQVMLYAINEKVRLDVSASVGPKDFETMKRSFISGFVSIYLWMACVGLLAAGSMETLLPYLGIHPNQARLCAYYFRFLAFLELIRFTAEVVMTHVLAQGIQAHFSEVSMIGSLFSFALGLVSHFYFNMGIMAWFIARAMHELIMVIMVIPPFFRDIDPRTRGWINIRSVLHKYPEFIWDCCKFCLGNITEWIGMEMAIIFTGLMQSEAQLAALTSILNLIYIPWGQSFVSSAIGTSRINILLGLGYTKAAKNFYLLFGTFTFAYGCLLSTGIYCLKPYIVELYTANNPDTAAYLGRLMSLYVFCLPVDLLQAYTFSSARLCKLVWTAIIINLLLPVALNAGLQYWVTFHVGGTCVELVTAMYSTIYLTQLVLTSRILLLDWSTIAERPTTEHLN